MCVYCVFMARVNIYLPDDLADAARARELNVSMICREAIQDALGTARRRAWLAALEDRETIEIDTDEILGVLHETRSALEREVT